jgi:protein SCO1/2
MASELAEQPSPPVAAAHRWLWAGLGLVLVAVLGAGVLWTLALRQSGRSGAPPPETLPILGEVPDFALTAEDGRPFRRAGLKGRIWVAGFIFTRCSTMCPRITTRMARLQDEADLVTFTVDPEGDRPEVLRAYAEAHGANPGRWRFLTGERGALYRLIGDGFHLSVSPNPHPETAGDLITHSDRLVLVDPDFRMRGTYSSGDPEAMGRLRSDLDELRRECGCPSPTSRP